MSKIREDRITQGFSENTNLGKGRGLNWIKALMVNAVTLMLVLVTTRVVYETNDDFAIASRIADGYPYVNFINYYLCKLIIPIQKVFADWNIYVILQMVLAFIAFTVLLKVLLDRSNSVILDIVISVMLLIYSADHYCSIQFTKTAALMMVVGMLLMIDSMTNRRPWYYYVYSILFLYLGVAFRIDGLVAVIGFAGIYLIFWAVANRDRICHEGYLKPRKILLYLILLALIGGCYGFQMLSENANVSNDQLEKYKAYSELRSDIVDYPVYEYYDGNEEAYESIGISENDLYLIDHWFFDYDGAASSDKLADILAVDRQVDKEGKSLAKATHSFLKYAKSKVRILSFSGIHILMLLVLGIYGLIILKPRRWIYVFAIGFMCLALYLALFYMGRPAYRAMYVADIGATIWLLYYYCGFANFGRKNMYSIDEGDGSDIVAWRFRGSQAVKIICGILVAVVAITMLIPTWKNCESSVDGVGGRIMSEELSEYLAENNDTMFVMSVSEKKFDEGYAHPLRSPARGGKNLMGTGSWGTMSPYILDNLREYNMSNPIRNLIDNDSARYIGNKNIHRLEEYFNKWYGENGRICLKRTGEIDGFGVYSVDRDK